MEHPYSQWTYCIIKDFGVFLHKIHMVLFIRECFCSSNGHVYMFKCL